MDDMVFQEKLLLSKWNFPRLIVLMKKARVGVFFQGLQQSRRRRVFYPFCSPPPKVPVLDSIRSGGFFLTHSAFYEDAFYSS